MAVGMWEDALREYDAASAEEDDEEEKGEEDDAGHAATHASSTGPGSDNGGAPAPATVAAPGKVRQARARMVAHGGNLDEVRWRAHNNAAHILAQLGAARADEARARLAQATALNPLNPSRLNDLGPPAAGGGGGG